MVKPTLLMYSLNGKDRQIAALTAMQCSVRIREVHPSEYAMKLRELIATAPAKDAGTGAFNESIIVMAYFSDDLFSVFLDTLKKRGFSRDVIRAVMTPFNAEWDSRRLRDELAKEREAVGKARRG